MKEVQPLRADRRAEIGRSALRGERVKPRVARNGAASRRDQSANAACRRPKLGFATVGQELGICTVPVESSKPLHLPRCGIGSCRERCHKMQDVVRYAGVGRRQKDSIGPHAQDELTLGCEALRARQDSSGQAVAILCGGQLFYSGADFVADGVEAFGAF